MLYYPQFFEQLGTRMYGSPGSKSYRMAFTLLVLLREEQPVSVEKIATRIGEPEINVTTILDRLCKEGWFIRSQSPLSYNWGSVNKEEVIELVISNVALACYVELGAGDIRLLKMMIIREQDTREKGITVKELMILSGATINTVHVLFSKLIRCGWVYICGRAYEPGKRGKPENIYAIAVTQANEIMELLTAAHYERLTT